MIPVPVMRDGFLEFTNLDAQNTDFLRSVLTIGWYVRDDPNEVWTRRFLAFKKAKKHAIRGFYEMLYPALKVAMRSECGRILVSTAISSGETALQDTAPLSILGKNVAKACGWQWAPDLVKKVAHRSLHNIASSADRDAEVRNKYSVHSRSYNFDALILLDDIVTRGATLTEIARAVRTVYADVPVTGVALGKSERRAYAEQCFLDIGNSHIPKEWADRWAEGVKRANASA